MGLHSACARPLRFSMEAERAHRLALKAGGAMGWASGALRRVMAYNASCLKTNVAGIDFPMPLGPAAGFDKSGTAIRMLCGLSLGSVEIGSVSLDPSIGTPRPRLFRLSIGRSGRYRTRIGCGGEARIR